MVMFDFHILRELPKSAVASFHLENCSKGRRDCFSNGSRRIDLRNYNITASLKVHLTSFHLSKQCIREHGSVSLCRDGQKTKWRLQCKY